MPWEERILASGESRTEWERARQFIIGASDAKGFARLESVDRYFLQKLKSRSFTGNAYTDRGHEYEDTLIAATGIPGSAALIHAPEVAGFAATPDGITADGSILAEAKLRHRTVATGPTKGEFRQIFWQFMCVPEAEEVRFVEGELLESPMGWSLRREPQVIEIARDDPRVVEAGETVMPIAHKVLELLLLHQELEGASIG